MNIIIIQKVDNNKYWKITVDELVLNLLPDTKTRKRSIEKKEIKMINTQLSMVFKKSLFKKICCHRLQITNKYRKQES